MIIDPPPTPPSLPLVLVILDGWGVMAGHDGNVLSPAKTPTFTELVAQYPATTVRAELTGNAKFPSPAAAGYYRLGTGSRARDREGAVSSLSAVVAGAGLKQIKIAPTPRYFHLTHYFNGGREGALSGEERLLIPVELPPAGDKVETADSERLSKAAVRAIESGAYRFTTVSMPAIDLAALSGDPEATVRAVKAVDQALQRIAKAVFAAGGALAVTASHGRAEALIDPRTGGLSFDPTANPLPFVIASRSLSGKNIGWPDASAADLSLVEPRGRQIDIAPTLCALLGLPKPQGMTGSSLI